MRRIIYSLVLGLAVTLCLASVAFAESYSVDVVIDGKTVTLLVNTDNDSLVIDTKSPGVQIKSITQIAIVPTQTVTVTQPSVRSESQSFSEMSEDERLTALNYVSKTSVIAARYNSTLAMITLLLKQMTIAPTIAFTDNWRNQMTTQSEAIKNIGKDVQLLTVPTIFQPAHVLLLAAAAHFNSSIDLLNEALDTFDRNTINRAAEEMQAGSDTIMKAGKKIDEIKTTLTDNPISKPTPMPTPLPATSVTPIEPEQTIALVKQPMNVRSGPGTSFSIIGNAQVGESFTITDKDPTGDWYLVDYKGHNGWLFAQLISIESVKSVTTVPTRQPSTYIVYTVQSGDDIEHITTLFEITTDELLNANKTIDPEALFIGEKLLIPRYK